MPSVPLSSLLLAAALPGSPGTPGSETHPFSVHDMLAMERISDPRPSPDGAWVTFTVRTTDLEADRGRTDVWIAPVLAEAGAGPRRLTTDPASDWGARWLPDGSGLVFLSTRGGSAQVWRLPLAGGEAEQVTDLPLDVGTLAVFPDGQRLLVTMDVYPDASPAETAERDAAREEQGQQARIYDELLFRHWDQYEDGKRSHLFTLPLEDGRAGAPVDLMSGLDADCPTRPFGGDEEIAISPDGVEVVFAAKLVGEQAAWSTDVDLWSVSADGSVAPVCLTTANEAWDTAPAYSPDGRLLAYSAMERPGFEADRFRVVLLDLASGEHRVLTDELDLSVSGVSWSDDGETLYAAVGERGEHPVYAIDVASGEARRLLSGGYLTSVVQAGDRLVFAQDSLHAPVELFSSALDGSDVRGVTALNSARVAAARMGAFEQFSFPGWNDETVYGYVMKPAGFEAGRKYPVAFLIHGGPQGSFGNHFHYRWNPQAYAGAGYAAVFIDFHGSTGYGQAFTDSISGDWGGKPYEDLMKGLDHALASYPFLDGERVAALGASYGGYMINWIAGQTDRFRCLVNHDGVFDNRAMYYETEELWFPEWEHGGPAFAEGADYELHNPVAHVASWTTPMLVIHGALDYRVPETQGFAAFTALQRRGVPSRLLHFPDENHWVLKPSNSILWHETVLDWLARWTGPAGGGDEGGADGEAAGSAR